MTLKDYDLSEKLLNRLTDSAEGVVVAGSPGSGKSTFASALANLRKKTHRQGHLAGSAGKKLDDALKSAGLSRDEVYITNVVKCRPPKNRVPEEIERAACCKIPAR